MGFKTSDEILWGAETPSPGGWTSGRAVTRSAAETGATRTYVLSGDEANGFTASLAA